MNKELSAAQRQQRFLREKTDEVYAKLRGKPSVTRREIRKRVIQALHVSQDMCGVPRSLNGNRLGLRKRAMMRLER
jgi:hypothetical protein